MIAMIENLFWRDSSRNHSHVTLERFSTLQSYLVLFVGKIAIIFGPRYKNYCNHNWSTPIHYLWPNTFYSLAEFPLAFWYLFYFLLQKIFFWFSECPDSAFPILNLFDQIATETFSLICYIFHFNCFIYIIWFFSIALKL